MKAKKLENEGLKEILVSNESLYGKFLHKDLVIGEDTFKIGTEINETILNKILEADLKQSIIQKQILFQKDHLLQTILNDKNENKNDAITEIYKVLRPGEPPTIEIATQSLIIYFLALTGMIYLMLVE